MRGVGRQLIFEDDGDRLALLGKLVELRDAGISIRQAVRITGIGRKPISDAFAAERRKVAREGERER